MASSHDSRRAVFRRIAQHAYTEWPAYRSTPLYDRSSLDGLEADIRAVSQTWFRHDRHESVETFVCSLPLAYFTFDVHDRYVAPTRYGMEDLFRVFILKELHRWDHETTLVGYLERRPALCEHLGLETVPDQSTLWRSWHERFTEGLRETVQNAARTILMKAQNAGVAIPRDPERCPPSHRDEEDRADPDNQRILDEAATVTDHVSRIVFLHSR